MSLADLLPLNRFWNKFWSELKIIPILGSGVLGSLILWWAYLHFDRPRTLALENSRDQILAGMSQIAVTQSGLTEQIKRQVENSNTHDTTAEFNSLEGKLSRNEQSQYEIESKVAEETKLGIKIDHINYDQLQDLKIKHEGYERRMQALLLAHPELHSQE